MALPAGPVTARTAGFVSRAGWGARPPKQVSHNITPGRGGVAVHYGGDPVRIGSHADCTRRVKAWQDFHMGSRGWSDIAYSGLVCNHGYFYAGRGYGVRTAAQGSNDGNDRFLAICWINPGAEPTVAALEAIAWGIATFRKAGAGTITKPHRDFHSTSCPGGPLAAYTLKHWDKKPIGGGGKPSTGGGGKPKPPAPVKVPTSASGMTVAVQRAVHVPADGIWGPGTDTATGAVRKLRAGHPSAGEIKAAQKAVGVAADGAWGPKSKAAWAETVRELQGAFRYKVPGLGVDGAWGPATEAALWTNRTAALAKR
jgi:hypothetical protein